MNIYSQDEVLNTKSVDYIILQHDINYTCHSPFRECHSEVDTFSSVDTSRSFDKSLLIQIIWCLNLLNTVDPDIIRPICLHTSRFPCVQYFQQSDTL